MTQMSIFDLVKATEKKGRITAQRLSSIENRVLDTLKQRDLSTQEIMDYYDLSDIQVRKVINNIRNRKSSNVIVGNVDDIRYNGRIVSGYSVKRDNGLAYKRLASSIETHLTNNPYDLEKVYKLVNGLKRKIENERLSVRQQRMKLSKYGNTEVNFYNEREEKWKTAKELK